MYYFKNWADSKKIQTGCLGEIVNGVEIIEENRATVWETVHTEIAVLRGIYWNNYIRKGVRAILFGIPTNSGIYKYAVFVESGFLRDLGP